MIRDAERGITDMLLVSNYLAKDQKWKKRKRKREPLFRLSLYDVPVSDVNLI